MHKIFSDKLESHAHYAFKHKWERRPRCSASPVCRATHDSPPVLHINKPYYQHICSQVLGEVSWKDFPSKFAKIIPITSQAGAEGVLQFKPFKHASGKRPVTPEDLSLLGGVAFVTWTSELWYILHQNTLTPITVPLPQWVFLGGRTESCTQDRVFVVSFRHLQGHHCCTLCSLSCWIGVIFISMLGQMYICVWISVECFIWCMTLYSQF